MRERRRAWRPGGWPSRSLPISQKRCLPYSSSRPSTTPFLLHFDYRISHHSQRPYDHQYNINSLPKEFEQQMLGGYVRTPQSSGGHGRVLTYHITASTIVIVVITFFIINIKHTIIIITCIFTTIVITIFFVESLGIVSTLSYCLCSIYCRYLYLSLNPSSQ